MHEKHALIAACPEALELEQNTQFFFENNMISNNYICHLD